MVITVSADTATIITASGTCGENLIWTLDVEGTLTISGIGEMINFSSVSEIPWSISRNSINSVVIEDNVTTIGDYAFSYCESLTSIEIPKSVTTIGY